MLLVRLTHLVSGLFGLVGFRRTDIPAGMRRALSMNNSGQWHCACVQDFRWEAGKSAIRSRYGRNSVGRYNTAAESHIREPPPALQLYDQNGSKIVLKRT